MSVAGGAVHLRAPAKINLALRILGRRADGYHELETLFQAVGLHDVLRLERTDAPGLELVVEGADVGPVHENLVWRAAQAFFAELGQPAQGVLLHLEKRIPAGAGLGGGSSDAAATLRGLQALFSTELPHPRLHAIGAALGSDVPFFLGSSGLALGTGRGEVLKELEPHEPRALVLGLPQVACGTAAMYGALARRRAEQGQGSAAAMQGGSSSAAQPRTLLPLTHPFDRAAADALACNDFEPVAMELHPSIAQALNGLREEHAVPALLSGSGSAVFGFAPTAADAERIATRLSAQVADVDFVATTTLARLPGPDITFRG